jgi:rhodanese-related sulfurtransferase
MKKFTALILSLCVAAAAFAGSSKFADISHEELQAAVKSGKAVLLDANGTETYQAGHVPGAIDYIANQDRLASLLPADKNALVVAYCGNEQCGAYAAAAEAATKLGYKNVKHYAPGIAGWKKSGAPIEKSKS